MNFNHWVLIGGGNDGRTGRQCMDISLNILKSMGIIILGILISLAVTFIRGFSSFLSDTPQKNFIIFMTILGFIGGIVFSVLIVWM